jgi:hypothetical protein
MTKRPLPCQRGWGLRLPHGIPFMNDSILNGVLEFGMGKTKSSDLCSDGQHRSDAC